MAVAHSLTEAEREQFLAKTSRWRGMDGAEVADVLDMTTDHDMFLDKTEPFYERFSDQIPSCEGDAVAYAMHAIVILGLELTPARLASFLQRAGTCEAPRYPEVEAGILMSGSYRDGAPCVNHLMVMARAEQGLRAAGVDEYEITQFRAAVRETGLPGYSRNVADIAAWVTLVDRYTPLPRKVYDPLDDIATVLAWLKQHGVDAPVRPALANLRSHLDMRTAETIKSSLAGFLGRTEEL